MPGKKKGGVGGRVDDELVWRTDEKKNTSPSSTSSVAQELKAREKVVMKWASTT